MYFSLNESSFRSQRFNNNWVHNAKQGSHPSKPCLFKSVPENDDSLMAQILVEEWVGAQLSWNEPNHQWNLSGPMKHVLDYLVKDKYNYTLIRAVDREWGIYQNSSWTGMDRFRPFAPFLTYADPKERWVFSTETNAIWLWVQSLWHISEVWSHPSLRSCSPTRCRFYRRIVRQRLTF